MNSQALSVKTRANLPASFIPPGSGRRVHHPVFVHHPKTDKATISHLYRSVPHPPGPHIMHHVRTFYASVFSYHAPFHKIFGPSFRIWSERGLQMPSNSRYASSFPRSRSFRAFFKSEIALFIQISRHRQDHQDRHKLQIHRHNQTIQRMSQAIRHRGTGYGHHAHIFKSPEFDKKIF